jgi:hypothetical protein
MRKSEECVSKKLWPEMSCPPFQYARLCCECLEPDAEEAPLASSEFEEMSSLALAIGERERQCV